MPTPNPESIHPALWKASQLARVNGRTVSTGYPVLTAELPGGGWPTASLIELLVRQPGVGELRLLRPALAEVCKRPIALIQPPQTPQALALASWGVPPERLLWIDSVEKLGLDIDRDRRSLPVGLALICGARASRVFRPSASRLSRYRIHIFTERHQPLCHSSQILRCCC
ncbi:hypothetical protein F7R26_038390 (plasmid) [Cupriavidus basilensis]|uniref:Uncharacterized protein n=1 Tax=Cupriavidus basilensis TaxID=68895 RepID=A0A7M2HC01_9BURK|nr:hypothetical protein F7R26_038390 [Cupriavidus basilensis]